MNPNLLCRMWRAGSSLRGGWAHTVCLWLEAHWKHRPQPAAQLLLERWQQLPACSPLWAPHTLKGSLLRRSGHALMSALSSLPLAPSLRQQMQLPARSKVSCATSPSSLYTLPGYIQLRGARVYLLVAMVIVAGPCE